MWAAYIDRLEYARAELEPVMNAYVKLLVVIDRMIAELRERDADNAGSMQSLHELNYRQIQYQFEHGKDDFVELYSISKALLPRLLSIQLHLKELSLITPEYTEAATVWQQRMNRLADKLDDLALRHFYAAIRAGAYASLTALCAGGALIRSIACCLVYPLIEDSLSREEMKRTAFRPQCGLQMLCSFGSDFDFYTFDDDQNILLPEVADMLFHTS